MTRVRFQIILLTVVFQFLLLPETAYANQLRLILHFDVNKTLIAADRAGDKSPENVVSHLFAEKTFWTWDKEKDEQMSYYDYVYRVLIPGERSDQNLKARRKHLLDHFISNLKKSDYPLAWELVENYHLILSKLRAFHGDVFPSFYKMLQNENKYDILLLNDMNFVDQTVHNFITCEVLGRRFMR